MKRLFLLVSLITIDCSLVHAQSWIWAYANKNNDNLSSSDPLSIAADSAGNIYETGGMNGSVNFGTYTIVSSSTAGSTFIDKRDNNGTVLWVKGGIPSANGYCFGISIVTDNVGNSYITGEFKDSAYFDSFSLYAPSLSYFLVKYDPNGNVLWAKCAGNIGYSSQSYGFSVYCDVSGDVLISGSYSDSVAVGSYTLTTISGSGAFLAKYDASGNVLWVISPTQSAPNADVYGGGVVADNTGNVYWSGLYEDSSRIGPYSLPYCQYINAYLAKLNSSGIILWLNTPALLGNNARVYDNSYYSDVVLTIDRGGNVYMSDVYTDTIVFGTNVLFSSSKSSDNVFLVKYAPAGTVLWAKTSTGYAGASAVHSLSASPNQNNIYMSGTLQDTIAFGSVTVFSKALLPSFLMKFDTSGNALCGTSVDNYNDDNNGVVADPLGDDVFFNGDAYVDSCYFGKYLLIGSSEYGFIGKWTCNPVAEGIEEVQAKEEARVYPNPNNGAFTLQVNSERLTMNSKVEIYNMLGNEVYYKQFVIPKSKFLINLSSQPSGIYLYRITDAKGGLIKSGKLVIEK